MSKKVNFLLTGAIPMWMCWAVVIYLGSYHFSESLALANVWASVGTTILGVWIHMIWVDLEKK